MLRQFVRRTTLLQRMVAHTRARRLAREAPEGIVPPVPRRIIVEPTNACNLACAYCGNKNMVRPATYLDPLVYARALDEMVELGIPRLTLHTIGEPTLHPRIAELVAMAVERERCVVMSTNGTLLTEALARELVHAAPELINISVDSADPETLRILRPGLDLDWLVASLRRFRRIRDAEGMVREGATGPVRLPLIVITCVLTRYFTRRAERRFFEVFGDLADDFHFHPANNHGGYVPANPTAPRRWVPAPLREAVYGRLREPCTYPWDALNLLSDGTVTVCRFDFDALTAVGRFPESSIRELWRGEAIRELRRAHLAFDYDGLEACRVCSAARYENRAEHRAITRRILRRNGITPRRDGWLGVEPFGGRGRGSGSGAGVR